jgi:predicted metal-dependent phosphoesterase TrpH
LNEEARKASRDDARVGAQEVPGAAWNLHLLRLEMEQRPAVDHDEQDWIKVDLHIHTLEDPKDHLDYSAHQLLERAHALGFRVLAITLHDKVFDRPEVFVDAAAMGILLIPAAELRLEGADVVLLNVQPDEIEGVRTLADLRGLRARRGASLFCFAPHPFFVFGSSLGERLLQEIDLFDAIEICHFHKGWFDLNRRARRVAAAHRKPLLATSDAHRLSAFGAHYTSLPRPADFTVEGILQALRAGPLRLASPPSSWRDLFMVFYFVFLLHPVRKRIRRLRGS